MKKHLLIIFFLIPFAMELNAQIPYFAGTAGYNKLYSYTSLKVRPGINAQETYTTFQYGIGDSFAAGMDLNTGINSTYIGYLVRYGYRVNKSFNIGAQVTPSFDLNDSHKFGYLTSALYMNGAITNDSKLFWVSNTWYGVNRGAPNTISQWWYLGYSFDLKKVGCITPMLGTIHSWEFDSDADIAIGFYYSCEKFNFYLWGNDLLKCNPRLVVGVDFLL